MIQKVKLSIARVKKLGSIALSVPLGVSPRNLTSLSNREGTQIKRGSITSPPAFPIYFFVENSPGYYSFNKNSYRTYKLQE